MGEELKELKSVLKSLVVSSPTQVDVRSLLRDYREMMGCPLPLAKYGYRDALTFLTERCADCFLIQGPASNPVLTLIVPETLKHIDQFVQRQKLSSHNKFKAKRRSVPGELISNPKECLVAATFNKNQAQSQSSTSKELDPKPKIVNVNTNYRSITKTIAEVRPPEASENNIIHISKTVTNLSLEDKKSKEDLSISRSSIEGSGNCTSSALANFLKKRMPLYNRTQHINGEKSSEGDKASSKGDDDSGRQTSSTNSLRKASQLEELKAEVFNLISEHPKGVYCTDLIRLYRERYGRELNFTRFGYTSIIGLVCVLGGRVRVWRPVDTGDWLVAAGPGPSAPLAAPPPAAPAAPPVRRLLPRPAPRYEPAARASTDPDDALPGIDFDPDVFPADCVHFLESIPGAPLADVAAGAMLECIVGEVYSPSHFWLIRLGDRYDIAMEKIMDEMTKYYTHGEGRERSLALGAVRVGHYCSSVFEGDWHRAIIVRVLDSDTVKVRHVDYGTVETVSARALKPLRREWAQLPAQAIRARMAGVRPPAAGRRWPHAACAHLLRLVTQRRLVASVVARDREEDILEVFLIDTATEDDVNLSEEMIRSGHADPRSDSVLATSECYLFPRFEALETGATPNYGDIYAYLRDGIALEYVDEYRRHVPACLPPTPPPLPSPPRSPTPSPPTPPAPPPRTPHPLSLPSADTTTDSEESPRVAPHRARKRLTRAVSFPEERPRSPSTTPPRARSVHAVAAPGPDPTPVPPVEVINRVPLLHPRHEARAPRPPPPPPSPRYHPPVRTPVPHAYSQMMPVPPYAGFPPFPGAVPLYPPLYPPPPPQMFVPQPPFTYCSPVHAYPPHPPPQNSHPPPQNSHPPPQNRHPQPQTFHPAAQAAYPASRNSFDAPVASTPAPAPAPTPPSPTPPPPYNEHDVSRTSVGEVTLSVSECEIFRLLSRVDPSAAHWYMADAISRAMGTATSPARPPGPAGPVPLASSTLNPEAAEFRLVTAGTQTDRVRPLPSPPPAVRTPPGFENIRPLTRPNLAFSFKR